VYFICLRLFVILIKAAFVALITMTSETLAFRQDLKFIYRSLLGSIGLAFCFNRSRSLLYHHRYSCKKAEPTTFDGQCVWAL
jgi:hypothetical protein